MINILELEKRVKSIYNKDPKNPELYQAIKDLAEGILVVKGMIRDAREADEISHHLATDFYMSIKNGDLEVRSWTKYMWLKLYGYRENYINDNSKEYINIDEVLDEYKFKKMLYSSSLSYQEESKSEEFDEFTEYLPKYIINKAKKYCKFGEDSKYYDFIIMSVVMTVIRDRIVVYKLPKSFKSYIKLLSRAVQIDTSSYIKEHIDDDDKQVLLQNIISYDSFEVN